MYPVSPSRHTASSAIRQTPAVADADTIHADRIYRSLALTAAFVVIAIGVVRRLLDPATTDPMWERFVVAGSLCLFAYLARAGGPAHRHAYPIMVVSVYLVTAWIIRGALVRGFEVADTYGLMMMIFGCCLGFRTRVALAVYLLVALAGVALALLLASRRAIESQLFMVGLASVALLTYVVQATRIGVEERLREAKDTAEAAVAARGRFLANMSHEIRTPMNGVIGMTSLLEETELTRTQRDYLRTIRVSGDALLRLINDILDFSKVEGGHLELERRPFNLTECVEGAVDVVTPAARAKALELLCDIDPELPRELLGDSLRLRQILVNLLSNAVKFTAAGEVCVRVEGALDEAGIRLCIRVTDTGIGIELDRIDRLFEAFVQEDSSTTRQYGGTGLGLSICRLLVELMGGTITVESAPEQGAAFRVEVPLGLPPVASGDPGATATRGRNGPAWSAPRVLLMEPNARVRAMLSRRLEDGGFRVDPTGDPSSAVRALVADHYELVVAGCDEATADRLRFADADRRENVALLRLAPMTEAPREAAARAGSETLYRPLKQAALQNALQRALARSPSTAPVIGRDPESAPVPVSAPAPDAAQGRDHAGSAASAGPPPLRILLAEDNPVNQRVVRTMLERFGLQADLAANGREAVAACRARVYDLVLLDLQMPEMDGLEAVRHIRAGNPGDGPHVVAMTANAMPGDRELCLQAGMDDYLTKPLKLAELRALIVDLGNRRRDQPGDQFGDQSAAAKNTSSVMSSSTSKNECSSVART